MSQYTELALRIWSDRGAAACPGSVQEADLQLFSEFAIRMGRLIHKNRMFVKEPEGSDFGTASAAYLYARIGVFARSYGANAAAGVEHTSGDPFAAWARTVLTNHYIDIGRSQKRFRDRRGEMAGEPIVEAPEELVFNGQDIRFNVSAENISLMEAWDPIDRLIIVCILRCWDAVPSETWGRWLREAGKDEPFPPAQFIKASKGQERHLLGKALGMTRNAIDKRISRLKSL